jgi:hypothetical protein
MKQITVAEKLKQILIETSPLIENYAKEICPKCKDVCCKQKHGVFRESDILYLSALANDVPLYDEGRPPEGPCQFMGPTGCARPRWLRPFKCTWYFCDLMLEAMNEGPQKNNRRFIAKLDEMVRLYGELLEK